MTRLDFTHHEPRPRTQAWTCKHDHSQTWKHVSKTTRTQTWNQNKRSLCSTLLYFYSPSALLLLSSPGVWSIMQCLVCLEPHDSDRGVAIISPTLGRRAAAGRPTPPWSWGARGRWSPLSPVRPILLRSCEEPPKKTGSPCKIIAWKSITDTVIDY